jgi:hypothetical protein
MRGDACEHVREPRLWINVIHFRPYVATATSIDSAFDPDNVPDMF